MLKYIELKSGCGDCGPAWIGHVKISRTGRTIYFNDQCFQSLGGTGIGANYYDIETHDEYWISGVKKRGWNRHPCGGGIIMVDRNAVRNLLKWKGVKSLHPNDYKVVTVKETNIQRFVKLHNEKISAHAE